MKRGLVVSAVVWFAVLVGLMLYPISTRTLRMAELAGLVFFWAVLLLLIWKIRPARLAWMLVTAMAAWFLLWPSSPPANQDRLRTLYLERLQAYINTPYVWGGEGILGIDCSGVVRKALVEALFIQGVRELNPASFRAACRLWWNDSTAAEMGKTSAGQTIFVREFRDVREAKPGEILPGDLAVTSSGIHVLAYLGDGRWINADPGAEKVCAIESSVSGPSWLDVPMKIVRWKWLAKGAE